MRFQISHTTRYVYDSPLRGECFMEARLRPLSLPGAQVCHAFALSVVPDVPVFFFEQPNPLGAVHHFVLRDNPMPSLTIHAVSDVETMRGSPFSDVVFDAGDWDALPALGSSFVEWLTPTPLVPLGVTWAGPDASDSVFEWTQNLMGKIYREFSYVPGATEISTPLEEFASNRRGVCQDYAHLMLSVTRTAGIPARYVSGYVSGGGNENGTATHGTGATHAWVECWLPHAACWKGFDPTNNLLVSDQYVEIAAGRDYADVPPTHGLLRATRGTRLPRTERLEVTVSVIPRAGSPPGEGEPSE